MKLSSHLILLGILLVSSGTYAAKPGHLSYFAELKKTAFSKEASLSERWQALQKMGEGNFSWFEKDLVKALQSSEWFMRNAALIAIKSGEEAFVRRWSERLLFDKALVVRTQAIKNLIDMGSAESTDKILKALHHKMNFRGTYSLWIRPYLAKALALSPPENWKQVFQKMLDDSDEKVQSWAIVGLEKKSGLRLGKSDDSLEVKREKWQKFFEIRRL